MSINYPLGIVLALFYTTHMKNNISQHYRLLNLLHSFLLLAGMFSLLGLTGWLVAGFIGLFWALGACVILLVVIPGSSSHLILYLYGARPFSPERLTKIIDWLANQSHLSYTPKLYYIPRRTLIAFSVGLKKDRAIAISDGMIRALTIRELAAVLAHEMSHIQSKDLWVMALANVINYITSLMALSGYIMILFYLPLLIYQQQSIPWLLLLILILAPGLSALMQLALSRTREFNADSQSVKLTGDPQGLISALKKMQRYESWLKHLLLPGLHIPESSLLRSHPVTEERIRRLQEIAQQDTHLFNVE